MDMKGVTREEAVLFLLSLQDQIDLIVQYRKDEYEQIVASQRGDSFHIKWVDPFINIVCVEYVCDKKLVGLTVPVFTGLIRPAALRFFKAYITLLGETNLLAFWFVNL